MISDVIIVGAGVAGLTCARVLGDAGKRVRLLERSRGVGGRCATRRVDGQSVDHGLVFVLGRDPDSLEALREVPGHWLEGWPAVVRGSGTPCQPNAFVPGTRRMAHANGMVLEDAANVIGPWVGRPKTRQAHLWRHARTSPECELSCPLLVNLEWGRHIGIAGELFAPGGGVEAAWLSGRRLALRLLEEVQG